SRLATMKRLNMRQIRDVCFEKVLFDPERKKAAMRYLLRRAKSILERVLEHALETTVLTDSRDTFKY
ncbi:MAG: hypothetical protein KDA77_17975, partial [Planctomycetaceae bacterium]|nr:hypothetical protein [Planctomycetaceae bacterium]